MPAFHAVLENRTAGCPMREDVIWTDMTPKEIQRDLMEKDLYISLLGSQGGWNIESTKNAARDRTYKVMK